jgi:non-specific protein-tyrosine kinase
LELIQYIQLLRRWWWLLAIAAVVAGGAAFVYGRSQDPLYQAQVKVFIGGFLQDPNPGSGEIRTGIDLATTYANLVTVRPTLESTIESLGLDTSPGALAGRITTTTVPETSILVITVTDTSPVQAANIANELANQLILNSPTNLTPEQEERRRLIEDEISALGQQIQQARGEVTAVEEQLNGSIINEERTLLENQRGALVSQISEWQQSVADLSNSLASIGTQTHTLRVVEPAVVPGNPINSSSLRNALVAALVGVVLAFGVVLLLEYLDDTFRGPEDVRAALNLPVLAGIVRFGNRSDTYHDKLVTLRAPNSTPVEGYRALRANLLYGQEGKKVERVIITSPRMSEGKSVTAANLGVALAKADYKTVIIDADLHRPQVHNIFDLENSVGLSSIFNTTLTAEGRFSLQELYELLQPTELPTLKAITSGPIPANPAELLGLPHIRALCASLEENLGTQIIVFDSPPMLAVVDSMALASSVGASVILVVEAGKTRRDAARRVVDQFSQVGAGMAGVVLNRITTKSDQYYYYYSYGRYRDTDKKNGRVPAPK